jgi:hypothetical protein
MADLAFRFSDDQLRFRVRSQQINCANPRIREESWQVRPPGFLARRFGLGFGSPSWSFRQSSAKATSAPLREISERDRHRPGDSKFPERFSWVAILYDGV